MKYTLGNRQAFTIVELIVIIVVIAILATLATFSYSAVTQRAQTKAIVEELQSISIDLGKIKAENGSYPVDISAVDTSTEYTYSYQRSGPIYFCLSATKGDLVYSVTSDNSNPVEGGCTAPTSAITCPSGYIPVPGNPLFNTDDFCVMKYEAKNVGGVPTSQPALTPWAGFILPTSANNTIKGTLGNGYRLITEAEWLTIAHDVMSVASNWTGGSVGYGGLFRGHSDSNPAISLAASSSDSDGYFSTNNVTGSNQRRTLTLTNGEVIWDFSGNLWELVDVPVVGNSQPGLPGVYSYTWKQWNDQALVWNSFPQTSIPSYGTPAASAWTTSNNLGSLYSSFGAPTSDRYIRGGDFYGGSGIFSVSFSLTIDSTSRIPGFRATYSL